MNSAAAAEYDQAAKKGPIIKFHGMIILSRNSGLIVTLNMRVALPEKAANRKSAFQSKTCYLPRLIR